jgi:hypothetical protein
MRLLRMVQESGTQSGKGFLGTLISGPMLYAIFALLATSPASPQSGCQLISCTYDELTCYYNQGVGLCCYVCYNYQCPDGSTPSQCRIECGAQC